MPYIKPKEPPFIHMQRLLKGYGYNAESLAKVLCVTPPTARKRLNNPELLTLQDLAIISRRAHIPWDAIREAVKV